MNLWTIIGPDGNFVLTSYDYSPAVVVPPLAYRYTCEPSDMLDYEYKDGTPTLRSRGYKGVPVPYTQGAQT